MTRIGYEYAQALFSLASDEGLSDRIADEMEVVGKTVSDNPTFLRILSAPNLSKDERCGIVDTCYRGRVHPYVLNFIKLLTEKGFARSLPDCCSGYRELYNEANGILPVTVLSAFRLTQDQSDRLRKKLEETTGKRVVLTEREDPTCLGGLRLDYDGKRVDDTVRHRLDSVRNMLMNARV